MTEVTQAQWSAVAGTTPSGYPQCGSGCPVQTVNWWETLWFANAVSALEGRQPCSSLSYCSGTSGVDLTCSDTAFSGLACAGFSLAPSR